MTVRLVEDHLYHPQRNWWKEARPPSAQMCWPTRAIRSRVPATTPATHTATLSNTQTHTHTHIPALHHTHPHQHISLLSIHPHHSLTLIALSLSLYVPAGPNLCILCVELTEGSSWSRTGVLAVQATRTCLQGVSTDGSETEYLDHQPASFLTLGLGGTYNVCVHMHWDTHQALLDTVCMQTLSFWFSPGLFWMHHGRRCDVCMGRLMNILW